MNDIRECKECISYAICRSNLMDRILSSEEFPNRYFNIVGAYAVLVVSSCDIQRESIANAVKYYQDKGYGVIETNDKITDLVLDVFDIDYDNHL